MRKAKKLYALLGVLAALSIAAFAVSRYEARSEEIRSSGEVVLAIPADSVTALAWENRYGTFPFSKEGESWHYDDDDAFPVDGEKVTALLEQFEGCSAAFTIEEAEELSLYGLDDPTCTIVLTAAGEEYRLSLGDVSKMDEQRYATLGDGTVYLLEHDPMEEFDVSRDAVIRHDSVPQLTQMQEIVFSGAQDYRVLRDETAVSLCADDVYFADGLALDTTRVNDYLETLENLSLTDFVTYDASEAELAACGLDGPELTVRVRYLDSDGAEQSLTLSLGRDQEELRQAENSGDYDDVTAYVRVGDSGILYRTTSANYTALMAASRADLRHQKLFTADFDEVTALAVTLEGEQYTLSYSAPAEDDDEDDEGTWLYEGREVDGSGIRTALRAVKASSFTQESAAGKEELRLTISLANEAFPTLTLRFVRYDGESCLAFVDGEATALVPRSQVVELMEAVNAVILSA